MRIRIRGPSGQSTANLDDATATIETLRKTIETETSLPSFDVKYGYPPKVLSLAQYPPSKLLTELDVKLNGEQLLISRSESAGKREPQPQSQHDAGPALTKPANTPPSSSKSTPSKNPRGIVPPSLSKSLAEAGSASASAPSAPSVVLSGSAPKPGHQPSSSMSATATGAEDPPEVLVPDLGGTLILRIMPDDNSCLFRAISSAVMSDMDAVTELRSIVASTIQSDPQTYTSAVLDNKSPDRYCRWIQSADSWGGQVELVILAKYFGVEIFAIDVQYLRVDKYNEDPGRRRCLVVYSGIHYDTVALNVGDGLDGGLPENDVKQFEPGVKEEVLTAALELCGKLRDQHYYTDTAGFKVRCNDCGVEVVGERGATEHAKRTGHYNFGEAS